MSTNPKSRIYYEHLKTCLECSTDPLAHLCDEGLTLLKAEPIAWHVDTDAQGEFVLVPAGSVLEPLICDAVGACGNLATRVENIREEFRPICQTCWEDFEEDEPDVNPLDAIAEERYSNWKERKLG